MPGFAVTLQVLINGEETPEDAARQLVDRIRRPGGLRGLNFFVGSGPPTRGETQRIQFDD